MKRLIVLLAVAGVAALSLTTAAGAIPNDGNGNKTVIQLDFGPFPLTCDSGDVLMVEGEGWVQERDLKSQRNVFKANFLLNSTYTNDDGETWTFRDRGPDRVFIVDGVPFLAITGRAGGSGVIGHVVINLATGDVILQAGNPIGEGMPGDEPGSVDDAACAALT